jgi:hypothetical protein
VLPIFGTISNRKKAPFHMWWKKLKQYIQWDFVEHIVWHTTPKTKDKEG